MQLDQLPSYVIVIAASNHAELLDRAVWRRFQLRLAFPAPDRRQIEVFLDRVMSTWPKTPRPPIQKIAGRLGSVSYAEALDFCQNVRRRHILGLGEVTIDEALDKELDLWAARVWPEAVDGERPEQASPAANAASRARPSRRKAEGRSPA
jgi:MoxR-like ATPase